MLRIVRLQPYASSRTLSRKLPPVISRSIYTSYPDTPLQSENPVPKHKFNLKYVKEWDPITGRSESLQEVQQHMKEVEEVTVSRSSQTQGARTDESLHLKRTTVPMGMDDALSKGSPEDRVDNKFLRPDGSDAGIAGVVIEDGIPGNKDLL
ncbi:hypothetical protein BC832DRAFT_614519 [Gaertneriomyces semiglobifer]|nr:hypothetical protein BC832DRAFT_614519 [Gaertneriomyces semiglobifer]